MNTQTVITQMEIFTGMNYKDVEDAFNGFITTPGINYLNHSQSEVQWEGINRLKEITIVLIYTKTQ